MSQSRDYTETRLLGFSYDFGVTAIRHQNADAIPIASALMRGMNPPDNIQHGGRPGGMAESTFCVSLFCDNVFHL